VAELKRLLPAYDDLVRAIREVDQDVLIFLDETIGHFLGAPNGFTHAPGGADESQRSVLGFHYYIPPQGVLVKAGQWAESHTASARRLGTGMFMTESCCGPFKEYLLVANSVGQSVAQWEWKAFCNESTVEGVLDPGFGACITGYNGGPFPNPDQVALGRYTTPEELRAWLRDNQTPYAKAAQGEYLGAVWNATSHVLEVRLRYDPRVQAPTEIYFNEEVYYPSGCGGLVVEVAQEAAGGAGEAGVEAANFQAPHYQLRVALTGGVRQSVRIRVSPKIPGCALA